MQDRMMLDPGDDDVWRFTHGTLVAIPSSGGAPLDRQVIALGSSTREQDFRGPASKHPGNHRTRAIKGGPAILTDLVDARWVAECACEKRDHRFNDDRVDRSRRRMVEIDRLGTIRH
jgi:hypothetical protein